MSLKLHIRNASLSDKVLPMSNEIINIVQTAYDAKAVAQADASPERVECSLFVACRVQLLVLNADIRCRCKKGSVGVWIYREPTPFYTL